LPHKTTAMGYVDTRPHYQLDWWTTVFIAMS
jgi:hypothetical protein